MPIKVAAAVAILMVDAAAQAVDAGSGPGILVIYSGTQPATPETAVTDQIALVEFDLPDPSFAPGTDEAAGAVAVANAITEVPAAEGGVATWFRITDSDGLPVIDGDVSDTSGTGTLKLSSTTIVQSVDVTIESLTFTVPKD